MDKNLETLKSDLENLQAELVKSRTRLGQILREMPGAEPKLKVDLRLEKRELLERISELPAEIGHAAYVYAMADLQYLAAEKVKLMARWRELDAQRQDMAAELRSFNRKKEVLLHGGDDLAVMTPVARDFDARAEALYREIEALMLKINLLPTRMLQQNYKGANLDGPGSFDNAAKHFARRLQNLAAHDL